MWMSVGREDSKVLPSICAPSLRRQSSSGSLSASTISFPRWFLCLVLEWGCSSVGLVTFRVNLHIECWVSTITFQTWSSKWQSASCWHMMWVYLCRALLDPQFASLANCPGISSLKISRGSGRGGCSRVEVWRNLFGPRCDDRDSREGHQALEF